MNQMKLCVCRFVSPDPVTSSLVNESAMQGAAMNDLQGEDMGFYYLGLMGLLHWYFINLFIFFT